MYGGMTEDFTNDSIEIVIPPFLRKKLKNIFFNVIL